MAIRKRRRRKRRGGLLGPLLLMVFLAAVGYIAYWGITQPEKITAGLFDRNSSAPAIAEASETENTPEQNEDDEAVDALEPDNALVASDTAENTSAPAASNDNPFAQYTYYIAEQLTEYEEYQSLYPDFTADEVVWRVNAGLNRPFFTDANIITDKNPLLVNPYNRLPDDFTPLALETIDESGRQATPETISAFRRMREGAKQDGYDLSVQSAYRTIAYQQGLYDRAGGDGAVARPGFSEHHTGRTLDLWGPDGLLDENAPTPTGQWVADHAHEYGFIVRYTKENQEITSYIPEPWHITYVGELIAQEMHEGGYGSLEEYVAKNPQARLP